MDCGRSLAVGDSKDRGSQARPEYWMWDTGWILGVVGVYEGRVNLVNSHG